MSATSRTKNRNTPRRETVVPVRCGVDLNRRLSTMAARLDLSKANLIRLYLKRGLTEDETAR